MPWAVAAAAVSAGGAIYSSNKAASQQNSAQNKNIAAQQQASMEFAPYQSTGANANEALNNFMGFGSNDSEESLMNQYRDQFAQYKKKSSGGGLGGAIKGGIKGSISNPMAMALGGTAGAISGYKGNKNYKLTGYDEAGLKNKVQAELAKQKATRESAGFGAGMRNFDPSQLANDAGYQWRMQEGQNALDRSQSARHNFFSGAGSKEAQRYGQGFGSNEFGAANDRFNQNKLNTYNMLSGQQGVGLNAAAHTGSQLNAIGDSYATAGANRAAATMGSYNALAGGVGQGINMYQNQKLLDKFKPVSEGGGMNKTNYNPSYSHMASSTPLFSNNFGGLY